MENTRVLISDDKIDILERYIGRIERYFGVKVNIQNENGSRDEVDPRNSVWVFGLTGGSSNKLEAAKKFVTAVTEEECECHVECSEDEFACLQNVQDTLETEARALLDFNQNGHTLSILTQSDNLDMAQNVIEKHKALSTEHPSPCDPSPAPCDPQHPGSHRRVTPNLHVHLKAPCAAGEDEERGDPCPGQAPSLSPSADSSHDSCYDSDGSLSGSRRSSCARLDMPLHEDVSRTASDTLAAEHSDQETGNVKSTLDIRGLQNVISSCHSVDITSPDGPCDQGLLSERTSQSSAVVTQDDTPTTQHESHGAETLEPEDLNLTDLTLNPDYSAKIEFGIRLGYSEQKIEAALQKLGTGVSQNSLLSELIESDESFRLDEEDDVYEGPVDHPWLVATGSGECNQSHTDIKDPDGRSLLSPQVALQENEDSSDDDNLRCIVLDGSNIAMSHGNKEVFSCQGIKLAVDWFRERNHKKITVFVPQWRKEASRPDTPITNQELLYELEKDKILVFTPARWVAGKRVVCYDDRYIIKLAAEVDGIVVSNDNYRDLVNENPEFKKVIEDRLLMYSFVNDRFMPPDDPYGRHGPSLDNFLRKVPCVPDPPPKPCPYLKKCTYGNKCKFYHPERGSVPQKSVTERLQEQAKVKMQEVRRGSKSRESSPGDISRRGKSPTPTERPPLKKALTKTRSLAPAPKAPQTSKMPLSRTQSLNPKTTCGNETEGLPHPSVDPARVSHKKLDKTPQRFPESQGNLQVTVTSAASSEAYKTAQHKIYDEKLSKCRKEIEISEEKARKETEKPKPEYVIGFHNDQEGASLKPPTHWSSMSHETLRATHSDPQSFHCGHLALAKKLSDEGKDSAGRRASASYHQNQASHAMLDSPQTSPLRRQSPTPATSPPQPQVEGEGQGGNLNQHTKLARQYSLKGAEDPRWQQKQRQVTQVDNSRKNLTRRSVNMSEEPPFRFLGSVQPHPKPQNNHTWYQQEHTSQCGTGSKFIFGPAFPQSHGHQQLARNNSFTPDHHMQEHIAPGSYHVPAGRMASAPIYPIQRTSNQESSHQRQRKMSNMGPAMHRQNSTSDPQLHMHQDPCQNPMSQHHLLSYYQHVTPGFLSEPNQSWSQVYDRPSMMVPGHFDDPHGRPNAFDGMVVTRSNTGMPRGGSFENQMNPSSSFENLRMTSERSRSFEGHRASLDMSAYMPPYGQFMDQSSNAEHKHCGSEQSLCFPQGLPAELNPSMLAQRRSSPDVRQVLNCPSGQLEMGFPSQGGGPTCCTSIIMPPAPSPPHPDEQGNSDIPFTPSDPRSKIFFHMCNLFPAPLVEEVMREYPSETQADKLCMYLLQKQPHH